MKVDIRAQIVEIARTYIDTPFEWHQRLRGEGIDCVGLPICVGREAGVLPPDFEFQEYGNYPQGVVDLFAQFTIQIEKSEAGLGDLVVMAAGTREPMHCGIIAELDGYPSIIHCALRWGVTEHVFDSWWKSKVHAAFRYPGVV